GAIARMHRAVDPLDDQEGSEDMIEFARMLRRTALAAVLFSLAAAPLAAQPPKKLIILGFDGTDANLTQKWMDEGKLPNLAKLRAQGTFTALGATNPSHAPA